MERLDFHLSRSIVNASLYTLDDEKGRTKWSSARSMQVQDNVGGCYSLQVYFSSSRNLLCFPAAEIRHIMVLCRFSNCANRISWNHIRFRGLGYTPAGEPITRGIYRYSRHPMYVTMVLLFLGVSVMSVSWVFSLFTIITAVGVTRPYFVKIEEAQCIGHYGIAYLEYMKRTPRWIGIPKSKKE
jgi:protein-S-isoprenylcysteine O-methyltransferase Ste14